MSLKAADFSKFIDEYYSQIEVILNLNLNEYLLSHLYNNGYLPKREYKELIRCFECQKSPAFLNLLMSEPANYLRLGKVELLIEALEGERPGAHEIFTMWKKHLEESTAELSKKPSNPSELASETPSGASHHRVPVTPGIADGASNFNRNLQEFNLTPGSGDNTNATQRHHTYIESAVSNGTISWTVDGRLQTAEEIRSRFGAAELSPEANVLRNGQVLYLYCKYDTRAYREIWERKLKLESSELHENRIEGFFKHLTNYSEESDFLVKRNPSKAELEQEIESFKQKIKPDTDYIVVILSFHGCNRTQLITDDLQDVDLYEDIVWKLDHEQFQGLDKNKPRLYLVNACQSYNEHFAGIQEKPPGNQRRCSSPYFIFFSTVPDENCIGHKKAGSVFFNAIYNGGFTKDLSMFNMVARVQEKVDKNAGKMNMAQTTSITQSSTFDTNGFRFTAEKPRKQEGNSDGGTKPEGGHEVCQKDKLFSTFSNVKEIVYQFARSLW